MLVKDICQQPKEYELKLDFTKVNWNCISGQEKNNFIAMDNIWMHIK